MKGRPHTQVSSLEVLGAGGSPMQQGPGVLARVGGELSNELESVIAFADYCAFLTGGRLAARAEQLVNLAHQIYAETRTDLLEDRQGP